MKIQSISIKNIRSFREETVFSFHKDFNIIIGPNGSGKSNLLDIITVVMRRFFLLGFQEGESSDAGGFWKYINQTSVFQDLNKELARFYGTTESREIKIVFQITTSDIENIKKLQKNQDVLKTINKKYRNSPQHFIDQISSWDTNTVHVGEESEFRIIDESVSYDSNAPQNSIVQQYLNGFEYYVLLTAERDDLRLFPNYLFFGPYRGGDFQNLQASLSTQTFSQAFQSTLHSTSKTQISLINLASLYFAEKRRKFEDLASTLGYEERWRTDSEVLLVTKYLKTLGYSWDLKLIDKNKNIYEIVLQKDERQFLISQASSGEKEILNFLLGIFAINMKNGIILVDEPELHLHPRWQKTLMSLFIELSKQTDNQFIVTTHSSIFVNSDTYNHLYRVYKNPANESRMVEL